MKTVDAIVEQEGISIADIAIAAGVEVGRVQAIVEGRWLPSPLERERIAAALGVDARRISWGHTTSPRVVRYHRFGLREDFGGAAGSD